jgi:hypothetical protein
MRHFLIALLVLSAVACRHRPKVVEVPVTYLGPSEREPKSIPLRRVYVVVENRFGQSKKIGRDVNANVPIQAEPVEVVRLVEAGFRSELERIGAKVAATAEEADVFLKVGLSVVSVEETGSYSGRLVGQIEVTDAGGATLASSTLEGAGTHQGRDYDGSEVNVTLNKALGDLVGRVFNNESLMSRL